jgi:LPXTG-motif cell wall-anchored protein
MNKKANWTLAAILGLVGVGLIVLPLTGQLSKWWIILGIIFLILAFMANK